jgi:hypothetical protein
MKFLDVSLGRIKQARDTWEDWAITWPELCLELIQDGVAVLPLVSATSDSIVIPLDRYLFPHTVSHSLPHTIHCFTLRDPLDTLSVGDESAICSFPQCLALNTFDLN